MYLHRIKSENFRVFGAEADKQHLDLVFDSGLNILVGENDAGKSSIVDAIRFALLTTSFEYLRFQDEDFHVKGDEHALTLSIEVQLKGLAHVQQAAIAEWLTYTPGEEPYLVVCVKAKRAQEAGGKLLRSETRYYSGHGGVGIEIGAPVRDLIRATYLKPLRDAEAELRPGRNSRLSQVLRAHKDIQKEAKNDFDPKTPLVAPTTLVGYLARTQHDIQQSPVIGSVQGELNKDYLSRLSLTGAELQGSIKVATEVSLSQVLERLELKLQPPNGVLADVDCGRGLGYNNVLFMATELLLLGRHDELALLLIEEPEAHLHPQLQARVLELLATRANDLLSPVQVILSTHSPNIASAAPVENLILVSQGRTFRLVANETKLEAGDYSFLRRFLDVTKANLFFAKGVAMVEGPSEVLLLPALAEACERSFCTAGVSMVNVGTVGLFRYARVLQRQDGVAVPIRVACLTDRDIVPDHVDYVPEKKDKDDNAIKRKRKDYTDPEVTALVKKKRARAEGGSTVVFVSDEWTFEYDLAASGLGRLMFDAVRLAKLAKGKDGALTLAEHAKNLSESEGKWTALEAKGKNKTTMAALVYKELYEDRASKPVTSQFAAELLATGKYGKGDELLAKLPKYLRDALLHLVPKPGDDVWALI